MEFIGILGSVQAAIMVSTQMIILLVALTVILFYYKRKARK